MAKSIENKEAVEGKTKMVAGPNHPYRKEGDVYHANDKNVAKALDKGWSKKAED